MKPVQIASDEEVFGLRAFIRFALTAQATAERLFSIACERRDHGSLEAATWWAEMAGREYAAARTWLDRIARLRAGQ